MSPNNHAAPAQQQPAGGSALLDRYTTQPQSADAQSGQNPYYHSAAPSISLPKGGGALRGIDEKFSVNAVNGTAGLSVPLPLTPGRGGFTPSLALSYNSGSGNSEFGLGWGLGLPAIQRRTDKRLPQYRDADESDVFLLAGAEDLVPLLVQNAAGDWVPDEAIENLTLSVPQTNVQTSLVTFATVTASCLVKRYRPRIEGLFARIEHIRRLGGASWWRVTTRDNVTTWYGLSDTARLAAPGEPNRIFKWLPELVADGRGNVQHFAYKAENNEAVPLSLHEHNRNNGQALYSNVYLKRVRYSNAQPCFPYDASAYAPAWPAAPEDYLMELVLDYGEHTDTPEETAQWPARSDAFSDFHPGFEVRTYRRCRRALMFHRFAELNAGAPQLVRALELTWKHGATTSATDPLTEADYITAITQTGYKRRADGTVVGKSLPPISMDYQPLQWSRTLRSVDPEDVRHAPQGVTGPYQWIDLHGEGLPGILSEDSNAWRYKANLGNGHFAPATTVAEKPSFAGLANGSLQWQDLNADGRRQLVSRQPGAEGFFELDDEQHWQSFRPFKSRPNADWSSPYIRMLDLNGDGRPDLLIAGDTVWTWYENRGTEGFEESYHLATAGAADEAQGPKLVLNDAVQSIFLADMNGDGLTDLVRIRNGEVCYWPNMGWGKFGAKVTMSNAPVFDTPDRYNPLYLQLTDISGTGAPDLVYLGGGTFKAWINLAGNGFGEAVEIATLPGVEPYSKVALLDFLGNGTGCIVWSSPLPQHAGAPLRYIDLMGGKKPYLMNSYSNGLGKTVTVDYKSSTQYCLADKAAGTPWATQLPFPVQCIDCITTHDAVSDTSYTQSYTYHHGYYDHAEREFRGFGRVETLDTESTFQLNTQHSALNTLNQPPVRTKTWYHTGAWMREGTLLETFQQEYFRFEGWDDLAAQAALEGCSSPRELREAHRALKGSALRQEVYAQDGTPEAARPYSVTASAYRVRCFQPSLMLWGGAGYASFLLQGSEQVTYSNERREEGSAAAPADLRVSHSLTLETDQWGNALQSAQVAYPRLARYLPGSSELEPVQAAQERMKIVLSRTAYTNDIGTVAGAASGAAYRLRLPWQQAAYELYMPVGNYPAGGMLWTIAALRTQCVNSAYIDFSAVMDGSASLLRTLSVSITKYATDADPNAACADGVLESLAMPYEQYALAFTPEVLQDCYGANNDIPSLLPDNGGNRGGGYVQLPGDSYNWWLPSGRAVYAGNPRSTFYTPDGFTDPWANSTTVSYWGAYRLLPQSVTDALGNTTSVTRYNWHTLQPEELMDANENLSEVAYDALGAAVAMAVKGKGYGTEGDTLTGLDIDTESLQTAFWSDRESEAAAKAALGGATWRCLYDYSVAPARVAMIAREQHHADEPDSPVIVRFTYTDGLGRVAMHKAQAADDTAGNRRWIASGKTVYNNKGKPVLQYEPYFTAGADYDPAAAAVGVSPQLYYDPLGRLWKTIMPDGAFSYTAWDNWMQTVYDANDTAGADWNHQTPSGAAYGADDEADAGTKAAMHYGTPTVMHLDVLGRPFFTVQQWAQADSVNPAPYYYSWEMTDILGNRQQVIDAAGNKQLQYQYNLLKAPCYQRSIDGGEGWMLTDAAGQPLYHRDAEGRQFRMEYDALRRVTGKRVDDGSGGRLLEKTVYADGPSASAAQNLRGQVVEHYDGGGKHWVDAYDFKGLPLAGYQQLLEAYDLGEADWNGGTSLGGDTFTTAATVDALGRMIATTDAGGYTTRHQYGRGGQLKAVYLVRPHSAAEETYVQDIHYNAKGQRQCIWYGNGTKVSYTYDALTYRLRRQLTVNLATNTILQDVYYYYDAAGNITRIRDEAADVYFSNNTLVEPLKDYIYDALYRLVRAEGRERIPNATYGMDDDWDDGGRTANTNGLQTYARTYAYTPTGNIFSESHSAAAGSFTRTYAYEPGTNRLLSTAVNGSTAYSYEQDGRGNMTHMPHLRDLNWNSSSELVMTKGGLKACYQYSGGQRIRKVVEKDGFREERIYLGSYERYRKVNNLGNTLVERDTVHLADDTGRVAMLEVRTAGSDRDDDDTTGELKRFIYSNHLQSSALELDEWGEVISYEEYHPYGTTAYQAASDSIKATAKRYRFTGKELDEESGLNYHGARYYAPWLCRWLSVDPINNEWYNLSRGFSDRNTERSFLELSASPYEYCFDNPVVYADPNGEQPPPRLTFAITQRSFAPWARFGDLFGMNNLLVNDKNFHGDNRGFSLKDGALRWDVGKVTSRLNQTVRVGLQGIVSYDNFASQTIGYPSIGIILPLPKEDIGFSKIQNTQSLKGNTLNMTIEGSDPLVTPAPDIDWNLKTKFYSIDNILQINSSLSGKGFPAYEAFISDAKDQRVFLFTIAAPERGKLTSELMVNAYDAFYNASYRFELDKKGNFTGKMWVGENFNEVIDYQTQTIEPHTIWHQTTIDEWNKYNWNKPAAPDCTDDECNNH